jgi:hypothetical protein
MEKSYDENPHQYYIPVSPRINDSEDTDIEQTL